MKRPDARFPALFVFLFTLGLLILSGCQPQTSEDGLGETKPPAPQDSLAAAEVSGSSFRLPMKIRPAKLTADEQSLVFLSSPGDAKIFDFLLDGGQKTMTLTLYKLENGEWQSLYHTKERLEADGGRLSLVYSDLLEGITTGFTVKNADSSVHTSGKTSWEPEIPGENPDEPGNDQPLATAWKTLPNTASIVYGEEIPLILQLTSETERIPDFTLEQFSDPASLEYDNFSSAAAVTVRFD